MGTVRDPSPSSTLGAREEQGEPTLPSDGSGSSDTARDVYEKKDENDEKAEVESGYEDRGIVEIEQDGTKRRVHVVVEDESGREKLKDVGTGQYTVPRW